MDFKKEFFKYFQFWYWFVLSLVVTLVAAFFYIGTVSPIYETSAIINISKKEESKTKIVTINSDSKSSEEDLGPEIMLITSNEFLMKVVKKLQLNIVYFEKGYIENGIASEPPFIVKPSSGPLQNNFSYDIRITNDGFIVTDPITEKKTTIDSNEVNQAELGLPFTIQLSSNGKKNLSSCIKKKYSFSITTEEFALNNLKASLKVIPDEKAKSTLVLKHTGTNPECSRKILENLIVLLNENIIINKQTLFANTVAFLNKRIKDFLTEKDSIESVKEKYLQNNDILVLENYIANKTGEKTLTKQIYSESEKQIFLTKFAIKDIKERGSNMSLGTDYKLEAPTVNVLLSNYNSSLLQSELLLQRAQKNNPAYLSIMGQLKNQKQGILNALGDYLAYLNKTSVMNKSEQVLANSEATTIPTKDKVLGNINSNLSIKEQIYIILLQKREEAILNGAVLESNMKTLNAPLTDYSPIFPKKQPFILGAFLFGLLLPFGIIFTYLKLDTNIHTEEEILNYIKDASILGVIPQIEKSKKLENSADSWSNIAEATRTIYSNIIYLLPEKKENKANVLLFTSSIKAEGKTFTAFHTSVTISNLNKKVLLVGGDLRNPQLHAYVNVEKNTAGLSNFLSNKEEDWKNLLKKDGVSSENLDILLSGPIPPNPSQLLTNAKFDLLIEEAKRIYDFIIIDTAPFQLVSDTLNFSYLSDVTIIVARSNFSDSKSLVHVKNFIEKGKLKNPGFIINGINNTKRYGYNYGYNYNYNYGIQKAKKSWSKKMKSRKFFTS